MSKKNPRENVFSQIVAEGTILGYDGREMKQGVWEESVYLHVDGFVYHLTARESRNGLKLTVAGKRAVGEYLRWVDGLFRPGELPGESSAVHFRAARKLRELI